MRCKAPRTVGFLSDGKTLAWSQKNYSKEYPTFQLPCSKCVFCRLEYARQWSIRCVHEAQMHQDNAFITLTYSDEHVPEKLTYKDGDFQKFMKRLRWFHPEAKIKYIVAGEYGTKGTKRPHWHACIFGWKPNDGMPYMTNAQGDTLYRSNKLEEIWGMGRCDFGMVSFKSAGYVARYHLKKAKDQNEKTIFKSSKGLGSTWLEHYGLTDCFAHGDLRIRTNDEKIITASVPRFYEKWLKKHNTPEWRRYVTQVKYPKILDIENHIKKIENEWKIANEKRYDSQGYKKEYTQKNWEIKALLLEKKLSLVLNKNRLQDAG